MQGFPGMSRGSGIVPNDVATTTGAAGVGGGGGGNLLAQMDSNPFFTGGLGLAVMGVAAGMLRSGAGLATLLLRRHLLMTLEVTNKDPSFPWVMNWLTTQGRRSQHLSVRTQIVKNACGNTGVRFDMMPGPGRHLIPYNNKWFWVERERQVTSVTLESGAPFEKVLLTTFGRDVEVFDNLLKASRELAMRKDEADTLRIFTSWGADWKIFGHPRKKRPLASVVLDDGVAEEIVADLMEWKASAAWYYKRGVPYRRGYLLHGPPGSGKTSFIYALAGYIDHDICVLSLSEEGMTDDRLQHALSTAPQKSIILLEDVDAAFVKRGAHRDMRARVTFSGLLNTLDGVASSEERIMFMTTNFIDRLDPALMRPGRVDVCKLLDDATPSQMKRLFRQFYVDLPADSPLADMFAQTIASKVRPSMAALQGYLLRYKENPEVAVQHANEFAVKMSLEKSVREQEQYHRAAQEEAAATAARTITMIGGGGRRGGGADGTTAVEVVGEDDVASMRQYSGKKRRAITAFELDKMMFNPQPGSGFEQ